MNLVKKISILIQKRNDCPENANEYVSTWQEKPEPPVYSHSCYFLLTVCEMDQEEFLSNLNVSLTTKPVEDLKNEVFSSEVASGKIKFLAVVESLQSVLTNENVSIRQKGIEFLSWLLSQLPNALFNCSEINVLVNFYCDCLKGHHNYIPPAVSGILELIKMKQITKGDLSKILVTLFQQVNCQAQLQPDRFKIYLILKLIIENYLEEVRKMGPDFVFGIISFIEGESDPFCLITIFKFLPVFIKNFDLGHLNEEMFELLSCYFPIDFNASAKENISITREDLAENLQQCLSASNAMSEQSIPLILEKADSTFENAKVDSYKLLKECCKTLKVENVEKHLNQLWKCLSKDVLPGNKKPVCEAGLSALTDVIHLLSKDESHEKVFSTFMNDILMTVRSLTNRVDENMFQPAIRVLVAAATSSRPALLRILHHLKTFSQVESTSAPSEKKIILSCLLPFLRLGQVSKITNCQNQDELSNFGELVTLYLNATASADYETRKLAFMGVLEIIPNSSQDFRNKLYKSILENITAYDDIRTSETVPEVWRSLAQNYPSQFYDVVSEAFLRNDAEPRFSNFMWALSFLADLSKFTDHVIPIFINVIYKKQKYVTALESLLNSCRLAKNNDTNNFLHVAHADHNVIERLIIWRVEFEPDEELRSGKALVLLSEIIALLIRRQDANVQQNIVDKVTQMFLGSSQLNGSGDFVPVLKNLTDVEVFEAVLGSVRADVSIPMVQPLREKLTTLALNSTDESVRLSCSRLLATFVNKSKEELASDLLSQISKDIFACLEECCDEKVKLNSSSLFTLVVKGVILRGGAKSEEWVSTWFGLLGRKDIGEAVAEGFRTVIEEDNLYLNLESHCNVRVLYRQKLFGNYSKLVTMYEMSDWSVKMNYLLALVRLLQGVPSHLVQMEISNIVTILARCLDTDKLEVLATSLEVLMALLEKKEAIFSDYIHSFVPKFLKLARFEGSMKIRMNALRCLYFYGFYPTSVLLPIKNQVIRDLEACLDDKKRLARKEAVRARCRWYLVGSPGEDILES